MSTLSEAAQAALKTQDLIIGYAVEWLGPEPQEGMCCERCGSTSNPKEGRPLAILHLFNYPEVHTALRMAMEDMVAGTDTKTETWFQETMAKQLRGEFNVTIKHTHCWPCIATLLLGLLDDMFSVKMILTMAAKATKSGNTPLIRPFTSFLFLGGERGNSNDRGYTMAHVGSRLASIDLLDLFGDGLRRAATDEYDMHIES